MANNRQAALKAVIIRLIHKVRRGQPVSEAEQEFMDSFPPQTFNPPKSSWTGRHRNYNVVVRQPKAAVVQEG